MLGVVNDAPVPKLVPPIFASNQLSVPALVVAVSVTVPALQRVAATELTIGVAQELAIIRATRLRPVVLYAVNNPPIIALPPPFNRLIVFIVLLAPIPTLVANVLSIIPLVVIRAMLFTDVPLYVAKAPAIIILPSACKPIAFTTPVLVKPVPILNVMSMLPSVFKRKILFSLIP